MRDSNPPCQLLWVQPLKPNPQTGPSNQPLKLDPQTKPSKTQTLNKFGDPFFVVSCEGCLFRPAGRVSEISRMRVIPSSKPVNNLTLDIWKRVVHNEVTCMISTDRSGMKPLACKAMLERTRQNIGVYSSGTHINGNNRRKKRWTYHLRLISTDRWPW